MGARINAATLNSALSALSADLAAIGESTAFGDENFRASVMQTNLYSAMLRCVAGSLHPGLSSAILPWVKPTSRGTEIYNHVEPREPIGKAIPKLESRAQTTGEAVYPSDEAVPAQGLYAALVYSGRCAVNFTGIDASPALAISGVVAVFTAADIPGANACGAADLELFVEVGMEIKCVGAPVAVVVATSEAIANQATTLVKIIYEDIGKVPIVNLAASKAAKAFYPMAPLVIFFE